MAYIPPVITQLCTTDGKKRPDPTAGSDCAMSAAAEAIRFATNGKVNPSIDDVRKRSGLDKPNPPPNDYSTTATEYAMAVNSFDQRATEAGYDGIGAGVHERGSWDDLVKVIKGEQKWVTILVSYAELNDREPSKSGDRNFRGAHAIGVFGFKTDQETGDGTAKAKVWDSLCDGRPLPGGGKAPDGNTWWKMSTLKAAADRYAKDAKDGLVTWITTPRSKPLTPPVPPEPPPCEELLARAYDLLGAAVPLLRSSKDARSLAAEILDFLPDTSDASATPVKPGVKPSGGQ